MVMNFIGFFIVIQWDSMGVSRVDGYIHTANIVIMIIKKQKITIIINNTYIYIYITI